MNSMIGRYLTQAPAEKKPELDLYSDKSALVLYWLLKFGAQSDCLSVREIARQTGVSLGLCQRIVEALVRKGVLVAEGVRTAKKYELKNPSALISDWIFHYDILKKCKAWTYTTAFSTRQEVLIAIERSKIKDEVCLALHSAADALASKYTNLDTVELYVFEPSNIPKIERVLGLQPKERGYEVLLVKPYYKAILEFERARSSGSSNHVSHAPELLTFLDLYHYPLRGQEQAEHLATKITFLRGLHVKES